MIIYLENPHFADRADFLVMRTSDVYQIEACTKQVSYYHETKDEYSEELVEVAYDLYAYFPSKIWEDQPLKILGFKAKSDKSITWLSDRMMYHTAHEVVSKILEGE